MMAPATPPRPQQKPRIAYALPSLLGSEMVVTHPRATPIEPAKTPCIIRMATACFKDVEVPNKAQVREPPRRERKRTMRRPCFSATVAQRREVRNWVKKNVETRRPL